MEKKDIASLLDSLCSRPLTIEHEEESPQLQAFYRQARDRLSEAGEISSDLAQDPDRAAAVLASMRSGTATDAEREAFERAVAESSSFRLEAQSALDFIDDLERSPETVPAHLLAATSVSRGIAKQGSRGFAAAWFAGQTRWRMAAACTMLLVAGGLSWSLYLGPSGTVMIGEREHVAPAEMTARGRPPAKQVEPAVARVDPCPPRTTEMRASEAAKRSASDRSAPAATPTPAACGPDADTNPVAANPTDPDHQLAGKTPEEIEAIAAIRRAEAARQAEAMRAAESAASKVGAAQAGSGPAAISGSFAASPPASDLGSAQGDVGASRPAIDFGSTFGNHRPAAARAARPSAIDSAK